LTGTTGYDICTKTVARLPMSPGYASNGYSSANKQISGTTSTYNYCEMTPISWISNAFLGYRGSVSYLFNVQSKYGAKSVRALRTFGASVGKTLVNSNPTTDSQFVRANLGYAGMQGSALTNQMTQAGLCVQMPFFSQYKFLNTDPSVGNGDVNDFEKLTVETLSPLPVESTDDNYIIDTLVATGPDFGLFYFLNVPTYYAYSAFPTAV